MSQQADRFIQKGDVQRSGRNDLPSNAQRAYTGPPPKNTDKLSPPPPPPPKKEKTGEKNA